MRWAAKHGSRRTAWLSLVEGANIEALDLEMIPNGLKCLGFHSRSTYLTPLQTALCYGSDSVARTLIHHGAISSSTYPTELGNCTNLHMAAGMGLTFALKILIDQGMDVEVQDIQLRTPSTTPPQSNHGIRLVTACCDECSAAPSWSYDSHIVLESASGG